MGHPGPATATGGSNPTPQAKPCGGSIHAPEEKEPEEKEKDDPDDR
jgi:hypothetical protein